MRKLQQQVSEVDVYAFEAIILPSLRKMVTVIKRYSVPLDDPVHRGLLTTILRQYIDRFVEREPSDRYNEILNLTVVKRPGTLAAQGLVDTLCTSSEPERTLRWLRMCYEADTEAELPQLTLWQEYQGTFAASESTHSVLDRSAFIKQVEVIFPSTARQKTFLVGVFVVRGIRTRRAPWEIEHPATPVAGSEDADAGQNLSATPALAKQSVQSGALNSATKGSNAGSNLPLFTQDELTSLKSLSEPDRIPRWS